VAQAQRGMVETYHRSSSVQKVGLWTL